MIKTFCDICEEEITEKNAPDGGSMVTDRMGASVIKSRFPDPENELRVEVITIWKGTGNAGQFCKYCILDALLRLDDRPKAAPPRCIATGP